MAYPIIRRTLIPLVLRHCGRIDGTENIPTDQPFLAVANHVSYLEPPMIAAVVIRQTAKRIYSLTWYAFWKIFTLIGMANWLGMIPVMPVERAKALDSALKKLSQGHSLLIFPEGKRNFEGGLLKAKTGAARLALLSGVPVLPIGYRGPPTRTALRTIWTYLRHGKELRITVGTPITFPKTPPDAITHERLEDVSRTIMRAIAQLCGQTYSF